MSGEHLVSKALFQDSVSIRGFDWCKDKPKTIGINSLTANVLCRDHNSALSDLDAAALRVWSALREFGDRQEASAMAARLRIPTARPRPMHVRVDGRRLERWAFKMMVNLVASGTQPGFPEAWEPPLQLARFVFGQAALPDGCGLGLAVSFGERLDDWDHVSFAVIRTVNREPPQAEGFLMAFRGLRFAGSSTTPLHKVHTPADFGNPEQILLRPNRIIFKPTGRLDFLWAGRRR